MRLSNLSLTFLPTPNGLSGLPGPGRPSARASSSAATAPGPLPWTLDDDGLCDGGETGSGVANTRAQEISRPLLRTSTVCSVALHAVLCHRCADWPPLVRRPHREDAAPALRLTL